MTDAPATTVRAYSGTLAKATRDYQTDAALMAKDGWVPTSQSYAPGSWGCGYFLVALLLCIFLIGFLIFIYLIVVKPDDGTLTVTYQRQALGEPTKVCPRCAETVKYAAEVCRFCGYEFVWAPTHRVPTDGMTAYEKADPASRWVAVNGGVEVIVVERLNDWARVQAKNGWTGWVDYRKLVSANTQAAIPAVGTPAAAEIVTPNDATSSYSTPDETTADDPESTAQ